MKKVKEVGKVQITADKEGNDKYEFYSNCNRQSLEVWSRSVLFSRNFCVDENVLNLCSLI